MKISDETKRELAKIGAEYTAIDGISRTLEDIVRLLIEEHKSKKISHAKGGRHQ